MTLKQKEHFVHFLIFTSKTFFPIMVEKFAGTEKMTASKIFDEYMKATSLGFTIQQKDNMMKPDLVIGVDDAGLISMKFKVKLNKKFDGPADNQNTNSIITLKNVNFVQKQT